MKPTCARGKVLFIVGPTAVGKSEVAFNAAKRIGAEIISCDSMQVYRGMAIMSQAPPRRWRRSLPHHLVEVLDPGREYSAAKFRKHALKLIKDIIKREKTPLIVGGSGLYVKALLDGLFPSPEKDVSLRLRLQREGQLKGSEILHSKLKRIDPDAASKIHPNDLRRIVRALEVYYLTGMPISSHKKATKGITREYDMKIFGLIRPREVIYKRINERVNKMFDNGLLKEVKRISKKKLSMTARASLGYNEVLGYLKGEYGVEEAKELLKKNTRRFAKRQLSWFRADNRIKWLDVDNIGIEAAIDEIASPLTSLMSRARNDNYYGKITFSSN